MEDLFRLSEKLVGLKERKDVLKRDTEKNNEEIEKTEARMVELMVNEEIQNFRKDGVTFYIKSRLFASIPDEFKDVVIRWFKEHEEYSGMVKEQINANTLSAWAKERIEEDDMPEEIGARLNIFEKSGIGTRSN